jgi:hypothetical protein
MGALTKSSQERMAEDMMRRYQEFYYTLPSFYESIAKQYANIYQQQRQLLANQIAQNLAQQGVALGTPSAYAFIEGLNPLSMAYAQTYANLMQKMKEQQGDIMKQMGTLLPYYSATDDPLSTILSLGQLLLLPVPQGGLSQTLGGQLLGLLGL